MTSTKINKLQFTHVIINKFGDWGFNPQPDILLQDSHLAFMPAVHPKVPI
jgi:hypothetical protein